MLGETEDHHAVEERRVKRQVRFLDWCRAQEDSAFQRQQLASSPNTRETWSTWTLIMLHVCSHEGRRVVGRAQVLGALAADHCFSQGNTREGDARYEEISTEHVLGCFESAVLDVGWRRSVGPLPGKHCGFWHGGMAICRLCMPEAHATCASADSWARSVPPQDTRPRRRCFPSVADVAKKDIGIADWRDILERNDGAEFWQQHAMVSKMYRASDWC